MPKSSMLRSTPISRSARRFPTLRSTSCMTTLSVISRDSAEAGNALASRAAAIIPARSGSSSCRADTLTAMGGGADAAPVVAQRVDCSKAVRRTHSPSGTISPVSSASGTKASGPSSPCSGCCQRTSASNPRSVSSARSTTGW